MAYSVMLTSAGSIPRNHVTTIAVRWDDRIVLPSGEVRPRVRSSAIWSIRPAERASRFGVVDYTMLFGYLLAMVGVGVYFAQKNKNTDDFYWDLQKHQGSVGTAPSGHIGERLAYMMNPGWRANQAGGPHPRPDPKDYSSDSAELAKMVQLINRLLGEDAGTALQEPVNPGTVGETEGINHDTFGHQ